MSVKKSLRDATLTNSKYSYYTNNYINDITPNTITSTEWTRNPAWLPMPTFSYTTDPTFLVGTGFNNNVNDFAIQSDGKYVIGGVFNSLNSVSTSQGFFRANVDGTKDTTFTNSGFDFPWSPVVIKIQSDGKILCGGNFSTYGGTTVNRLLRVNSDGSRDTSFSTGTGTIGFNDYVYAIAIQTDGKILVGGSFTTYQGTTYNRIIRLNSDGSVDTSFNIGTGFNGEVKSIAIQSDQRIVIGGKFTTYQSLNYKRIIRLNSDGAVDTSFGVGTGIDSGSSTPVDSVRVDDIVIQPDGKLIIGGAFTSYQGTTRNNFMRLTSDGSYDTTFDLGAGFDTATKSIVWQGDGKIWCAGEFTTYKGVTYNKLIRLNSDGSIDDTISFGTGFNAAPYRIALTTNLRLVAMGIFTTYQGATVNRIVRINSNEEKVVILKAIDNTAYSEVAHLQFQGNYTVDWGDGNIINYTSGTKASHTYNYFDANLNNTNGNVSFIDTGDLVLRSNHGYANTYTVSFANITTTTGITIDTQYYVINANTNYFQLSNTVGGSAVTLTNDGTGAILSYKQAIIKVTPQAGANITQALLQSRNSTTYPIPYETGFLDIGCSIPNVSSSSNFGIGTENLNSASAAVSMSNLERVSIFDYGTLTSTQYLFTYCSELRSVPLFNTSNVTTFYGMFWNCYNIQTIPLFNTANVVNMTQTLGFCNSLQSAPAWDLTKVTVTNGMFIGCSNLKFVPAYNTPALQDMTSMFNSCSNLKSVPLFNTVNATSMSSLFYNCFNLVEVPLFNTVNVTAMNSTFYGCYKLKVVPAFNTVNVVTTNSMFSSCYSLETVPWFNISKVSDMTYMFQLCFNLQTVPLFDTSSANYMQWMFYGCTKLKTVPSFNMSNVVYTTYMFFNCLALTNVPDFNTGTNLLSVSAMFYNCYNLRRAPTMNTVNVTDFSFLFAGCYNLESAPLYDMAKNTQMTFMFYNCLSLKEIPAFNTINVTSMLFAFLGTAIKTFPILNTSNVTNMFQAFSSCTSLETFPLIDTAKVTSAESLFAGCSNLKKVANLNTANVTSMSYMFQSCYSLKEIPALLCNSVTSMTSTFYECNITRSQLANVQVNHYYTSNNLAAAELNEIYTNLPTVSGKTIVVTGNWGTASDDPTIATAKGWTVTG